MQNKKLNYRIRPLSIDDYDNLIDLWQQSGLPCRPMGRDSREAIEIEVKRAETCFLGMFDDDKLIGAIIGTSDGRKGWINRLAINVDYRGQGLGRLLIDECEKFLFDLGLQIIAALIEGDNKASKALFSSGDYKFADDIYYYSKRLSDDV